MYKITRQPKKMGRHPATLAVLLYAIPALSLTNRQVGELNVCWNSVIHRLCGYHRWESVSAVLFGLGRLNIVHTTHNYVAQSEIL